MIIDFHTHIFPDAMAEKSIQRMERDGNVRALRGPYRNSYVL